MLSLLQDVERDVPHRPFVHVWPCARRGSLFISVFLSPTGPDVGIGVDAPVRERPAHPGEPVESGEHEVSRARGTVIPTRLEGGGEWSWKEPGSDITTNIMP